MRASLTHMMPDDMTEITVEIEFAPEPYIPARTYGDPDRCYPAEGGYCEVIAFRPTLITTYDRNGGHVDRDLSRCQGCPEAAAVLAAFEAEYEANPRLYADVQDKCAETANERAEYCE